MGDIFREAFVDENLLDVLMKELKKQPYENMMQTVGLIEDILRIHKVTVRATSGAKLIFTDQVSGEEYVVKDLGFPF